MTRVLVVDDNAIVRRGVVSLLEEAEDVEVVGEASNGREAVDAARDLKPDVVLLDIRMPVMDGIAAASALSGSTRVLMLTYAEEQDLVTGAIRAGASGYLVHGRFEPDELAEAVRAVAGGSTALSPAVTPTVFAALRQGPAAADGPGRDPLTEREREVMNLLARGLSNREISDELVITHKTVKNHLSRIYDKLDVRTRGEAVALWLGTGERS
ncbi:MAG TPA: response regulator transcription factor [Solirubrobacteraceae bacterium]|nr:response regulator transcription factor [Solirubrobacteraceae bacterium]